MYICMVNDPPLLGKICCIAIVFKASNTIGMIEVKVSIITLPIGLFCRLSHSSFTSYEDGTGDGNLLGQARHPK